MSFGQAQSQQFAALLSDVADAPAWLQTQIAERLARTPLNQDNQQTASAVADMMAALPLGNDAMVATPTALSTQLERDELQLARQAGRTTTTDKDIELMRFAIEAQVKQMIAAGATDADIKAAVGNLPNVTPELSQLAQQITQQQLDAEKFNLLSQRNEQAQANQQQETPKPDLWTTPIMTLAAGEPAQEQAPEVTNKPLNPFAAALAGTGAAEELANALSGRSNAAMDPIRLAELNRDKERAQGAGIII